MRTRSSRVALAIGSIALCASATAHADPSPTPAAAAEAKTLYREGARQYDVGDYDHAIESFQRAYMITGAPMLLLNIGQAQRLKGACAPSATSYRRYLEKVPATPHRAEVERRIHEMEECAAKEESSSQPSDVQPARDPLRAEPEPTARAAEEPHGSTSPTLGFVGLGVSAGGLAIGAVGLGLTLGTQADLDRACSSEGACPRSSESDVDAYERWRIVTAAGGAILVIGAAIAVVGFVGSSRSSHAQSTAQSTARTTPRGTSITLMPTGLAGTF